MPTVIFKYSDQSCVYPKQLNAVNQVCKDFGEDAVCSAGFRTLECQKATAMLVLAKNKGSYQLTDGSVYIGTGLNRKCLASAYGKSNHCYGLAMDMDGWFEELTNIQLNKYGLVKPLDYEPWHVQLIEFTGISEAQKITIRDSILRGEDSFMTVKEFQAINGLTADGVSGPKTKEKAQEVLLVCQEILGINYKTPEEVIKACTNKPDTWLERLKSIPYIPAFIMNIVKIMGGKS